MDLSKKFLFVNPDNTAGEFDSSKMFPVSSLQGIQELNATSVRFAVSDYGQADDTLIDITVTSGQAKTYIKDLVESVENESEAEPDTETESERESESDNRIRSRNRIRT